MDIRLELTWRERWWQHFEESDIQRHIERVQEYKALPPLPPQPPTLEERVASVEGETEMLTACVLEMSELVYV